INNDNGQRSSPTDLFITRGTDCVKCLKDSGPLDRLALGQLGEPLPLAGDSKVSTYELKDIATDRQTLFGGSSSNSVVKIRRDILYLQCTHGMIIACRQHAALRWADHGQDDVRGVLLVVQDVLVGHAQLGIGAEGV